MTGIAILRCAVRTCRLLAGRRLHLHPDRVGDTCTLPDGRRFVVFRHSSCDGPAPEAPVALAVWFHLRWVPAGARIRRYLFERESILNTLLYAGADGYMAKLWLVDPATSDYAGLYAWASATQAEAYGRYISAVLRPLSTPGSVGFHVLTGVTLDEYLASPTAPQETTVRPREDTRTPPRMARIRRLLFQVDGGSNRGFGPLTDSWQRAHHALTSTQRDSGMRWPRSS